MATTAVAVLFGGRSSEHGVSCLTAREVLSVIDVSRYDVRAVGITRSGRWVSAEPRWSDLAPGQLPEVDEDAPAVPWESVTDADVVFPLLHGPWGEDGTLQGLLDLADVGRHHRNAARAAFEDHQRLRLRQAGQHQQVDLRHPVLDPHPPGKGQHVAQFQVGDQPGAFVGIFGIFVRRPQHDEA